MDNGDATEGHAMTPQEFAKLMGAYPQPAENPLPTYGGYMDNSPANFSFVEFNDYFGAEENKEGSIVLTETELGECLPLQNGNYLFRDMELFLTERKKPSNGAKFMIVKRHKGKALEAITSYQNYLANNKIRIHSPLTANKHPSPAFVKEAPYAGAGSLFSIGQNTGLEGFTTSELTTSSAIHGDFDEASLNYSGHQNFEVRAESESYNKLHGWATTMLRDVKDLIEDLEDGAVYDLDDCRERLEKIRDDTSHLDAEMEMIDDSNARIKNRFGDEIGMVAVDDHDVEDAVVEVSDGSDVIQEVIVSESETKKSHIIESKICMYKVGSMEPMVVPPSRWR